MVFIYLFEVLTNSTGPSRVMHRIHRYKEYEQATYIDAWIQGIQTVQIWAAYKSEIGKCGSADRYIQKCSVIEGDTNIFER